MINGPLFIAMNSEFVVFYIFKAGTRRNSADLKYTNSYFFKLSFVIFFLLSKELNRFIANVYYLL